MSRRNTRIYKAVAQFVIAALLLGPLSAPTHAVMDERVITPAQDSGPASTLAFSISQGHHLAPSPEEQEAVSPGLLPPAAAEIEVGDDNGEVERRAPIPWTLPSIPGPESPVKKDLSPPEAPFGRLLTAPPDGQEATVATTTIGVDADYYDWPHPDLFVDASGIVHIVWADGNPADIYYITGTANLTGTVVFVDTPVNVSDSTVDSTMPNIVVDSAGNAHVVWEEDPEGPYDPDAMYSKCDGTSCSSPTELSTRNCADSADGKGALPRLTIDDDDNITVVWMPSEPNRVFQYSHWNGADAPPSQPTGCYSKPDVDGWAYPDVASDGLGRVHVAWTTLVGFTVLYYVRLDESGWVPAGAQLLVENYNGGVPAIEAGSDGQAHVAWTRGFYCMDVVYTTGDGSTWPFPSIVYDITGQTHEADIVVDAGNNPRIVWSDNSQMVYNIFYGEKTGETWTTQTRVSRGIADARSPSIALDNDGWGVHVVWQEEDSQTGNWSIRYRGPKSLHKDQTMAPDDSCIASNPNNFEGGPVNTYSGNYTYQQTDLSIPTEGQPLRFERSYNAHTTGASLGALVYSDTLGFGWTHNYNMELVFPGAPGGEANTVIFQAPRGARMRFADNGGGSYSAYPGIRASLSREGSAGSYTYTIHLPDQTLYTFDDGGKLRAIQDPKGNVAQLTYANGRLSRVEDGTGQRYLAFAYDGQDRLRQIADPLGRTVEYGYDVNGDLVVVTGTQALTWTYDYSGTTHLLQEIEDPLGDAVERNQYDADARVVKQWDGTDNGTSFVYYGSYTEITDAEGNTTTDRYGGRGAWTGQEDALGHAPAYTYDEGFNKISVTDEDG